MKDTNTKRTVTIVENELSDKITHKWKRMRMYDSLNIGILILAIISVVIGMIVDIFLIPNTLSLFLHNVSMVIFFGTMYASHGYYSESSGYVNGAQEVLNSLSEIAEIKQAEEKKGKSKKV